MVDGAFNFSYFQCFNNLIRNPNHKITKIYLKARLLRPGLNNHYEK